MGQLDEQSYYQSFLRDQLGMSDDQISSLYNIDPTSEYIHQLTGSEYNLNITDRSQIINPDAIIARKRYDNTNAGRTQLEKDLNALRTYAAQQEAAYLEYFNSPEQQNLRDRAAGLNPDIVGLSGSQGIQSSGASSSPLESSMSDEQLRAQRIQNASSAISGITSIIGAISGVAQLPALFKGMKQTDANIGLINAETDQINLSTLANFESLSSNEIISRLADAASSAISSGQSLDIAGWFADDNNFSNIFESYAPQDNSAYRNSFANIRKRMQSSLGKAYEQGKITADNQRNFSGIVADPRYSADQLVQIANLRPYMAAQAKMELARMELQVTLDSWNKRYQDALSVDNAVAAANEKNEYDAEFWSNLDGERVAAFQKYQQACEQISLQLDSKINQNLLDIYTQNPDSDKGFAAAYLFKSGSSASLSDYFYLNNIDSYRKMIEDHNTIIGAKADNADTAESVSALSPLMPYLVKDEKFGPFSWRHSANKFEIYNYKESLEALAEQF